MTESEDNYESAVALIGMAGRFPGAADPEGLWRNLLDGTAGLRELSRDELVEAGVDPSLIADPAYVRVGGPVDGIDRFDAAAFGFSPREAETMSPQHRLFLECAWEALERAGYPPVEPEGQVGVFGGSAFPDYLWNNVAHMADEPGGGLLLAVGNERDSLTSLVAYKLGLRGPSLSVQTFCSTSLVAVHLACQSLLTFESDIALAGGAFLPLPQPTGYRYEQGGITSPNGRVRSFDAAADGTVMGSGVGVVALKRMTDAIADGDVVHAVILGSAVNNDGRNRVGYTAPGVDGQAEVIATALHVAGVKPESIGYVECHATGTALGDSIELAAMTRVFRDARPEPCVLGSLKPSIGHLDRASGVTGLMRAAFSLRHGILPGTPGFETPNPALAAAEGRLTVLPESRPWHAGAQPRRAGVSSFGLGGTNAHVVLEQAPPRPPRATPYQGPHLLVLSAADPAALAEATDRLAEHLTRHPEQDLADVAFTLQVSRGHFALRRAVVCRDHADAVAALRDPSRWIDGETKRRDPAVHVLVEETGEVSAVHRALREYGVRLADQGGEASTVVVGHADTDETIVTALARCWLAGSVIDWSALHRGCGRRVELPTYPFQRARYWVAPQATRPAALSAGRIADPAQWTYLPSWRARPLPTADLDELLRAAGPWLVLAAEEHGEAVSARLAQAGAEVVTARPGAAFGADESGDFTVRPDSRDDLDELLRSLFVAPRTIVHGFSLATPAGEGVERFDAAQEYGFRSAAGLVYALSQDPDAPPADLVLLTSGACAVNGSDLRHPEHAALAALAPSIAQENPQLSCRHIDLEDAAGLVDIGLTIEQALAAMVRPHAGPVAVRGGEALVRGYEPLPLADPDPRRPLFRAGDTVLITGGLGDVGLVLARHLADVYGCRLVLTARTPLPPREQWPADPQGADRASRHIRNIRDLESSGAEVLALAADVGDEAQMREVVRAARERFGRIDAVIHAAGVQDPSFFDLVHLSDQASCDAHFRAKVHGFHVLDSVLGDEARERRMAVSSLSTVLGGVALGPYAAANAALEAYARTARLRGRNRWVSVAWDTWRVDPARLEIHHDASVRDFEMAPDEGVAVLERAFAAAGQVAQVVVSTGRLDPRLEQWVTGGPSSANGPAEQRERHARPDLATAFVDPEPGLESAIAEVWAATLGVDRVGANDDFFELGGHSLLAITLATGIRRAVPAAVDLSPTALVEDPTVRRLAARIAVQPSHAG